VPTVARFFFPSQRSFFFPLHILLWGIGLRTGIIFPGPVNLDLHFPAVLDRSGALILLRMHKGGSLLIAG